MAGARPAGIGQRFSEDKGTNASAPPGAGGRGWRGAIRFQPADTSLQLPELVAQVPIRLAVAVEPLRQPSSPGERQARRQDGHPEKHPVDDQGVVPYRTRCEGVKAVVLEFPPVALRQ